MASEIFGRLLRLFRLILLGYLLGVRTSPLLVRLEDELVQHLLFPSSTPRYIVADTTWYPWL